MSSRALWTRPLVLLLLLLAPAAELRAQSKQDGCLKDTVCRDAYYKALKQYDEGKYVEALDGFQSAYGRRQMPWLLLNIGRTLQRLGRAQEAIGYYERYKKAELNIDAATLDRVNKYIEQAKALLESPAQEPKPVNLTPSAGSTPSGGSEPAPSDPNKPTAGLQAGAAPPLAVQGGSSATEKPATPIYKKWWFWTIVGAVVVGGVATGVGVAAASRSQPAEPFLPTDPIFTPTF
jgi:tetratricopeptide (TPR) repeat protein